MKIGKFDIGYNFRPKIIAELGINHNGSLSEAKKLAELAAESGADFIKSQMHISDAEMSGKAKEVIPSHCKESIYEIIDDCSLSIDEEYELKTFIDSLGKEYLCTPFSGKAVEILKEFNVNAFKIGSGECNNQYVLKKAGLFKKPIIISTGMNDLESCKRTYDYVKQFNSNIIFMHTTNLYPTPQRLVRLGGISELQKIIDIDSVGLSDHTTSNLACLGAIALGGVLLERHFTDTKERTGPDIINSMTPEELKSLRKESEQMFIMRGGTKKSEIPQEDDTRDFAFATLVAIKDIKKGSILSIDNCIPKRPSSGDIFAYEYEEFLGRKANIDISIDTHIMRDWII